MVTSFFYPVIRLNTAANTGIKKTQAIYEAIIRASLNAAKPYKKNSQEKSNLELTFTSSHLKELIVDLLIKYHDELNITIGTLLSKQDAELISALEQHSEQEAPSFCLSPCFVKDCEDIFKNLEKIHYLPAIYSKQDLEQVIQHWDIEKADSTRILKLFPTNTKSSEDLALALKGPFPELNEEQNRIHVISSKESYEALLNKASALEKNINLVTSPQDYFQIRNDFLQDFKQEIAIFAKEQSKLSSQEELSTIQLAQYIRKHYPQIKILATGLINKEDTALIKKLIDLKIYGIGMSIKVNEAVQKYTEGKISIEEFQTEVENELSEHYQVLESCSITKVG